MGQGRVPVRKEVSMPIICCMGGCASPRSLGKCVLDLIVPTEILLSVEECQIVVVEVDGCRNEGCLSHVGDVTPEVR